ncbi:TetR/AcrR family transcriptional regulator [Jiangella sp. DSM 45060]|uniref:TetR/AcrR family transcriptional regulator n=1 Tax=Jiangella sp. DSM 45060 TaxID=1798224 RepID=UPI00087D74B2|nr:TetR/AcrR family transcriptional regulator [Jiangella sp. DSM 45060]SDT70439.1 DNA-binding transcriptional regulator, AcrR family [Jiangella sp. DSM 45060]
MTDEGRPGADTAGNIREVALDLFSRQGYERSTLREIADALGITKAAVYYHYRTKVEILDDLLRPMVDGEDWIIADAESDTAAIGSAGWRLTLVERYIDLLLAHRRVATYAMNDLAGVSNSTLLSRMRANDARLAALLANGDLSVEQRVRTSAALGVIVAILALPDVSNEELRPQLLRVVRDVLGLTEHVRDVASA